MPSNKSEKKDKEEAELSKNLIPKLIEIQIQIIIFIVLIIFTSL